jgi:hypothetical protein
MHLDSGLLGSFYEEFNEVGVELAEGAVPVVDYRAVHPGAGSDVGELERDEPTTDERDPGWQRLKVEEIGAVDQVLMAGEAQCARARPVAIKKRFARYSVPSISSRFGPMNRALELCCSGRADRRPQLLKRWHTGEAVRCHVNAAGKPNGRRRVREGIRPVDEDAR